MNDERGTPDRPLVRQLFRRPPQRHQPADPRGRGAGDPVERDRAAVVHPGGRAPGSGPGCGRRWRCSPPGCSTTAPRAGSATGCSRCSSRWRWLTRWLYDTLRHARSCCGSAIGVFVVAWIAQFVGHKIEGRKPSFLTDLTYLLIGPAWVLAKLYRKLGWIGAGEMRTDAAARGLRWPRPRPGRCSSASPGPATSSPPPTRCARSRRSCSPRCASRCWRCRCCAFVKRPAPGQWPRLIAVALCIGVLHFGLSFWALQAGRRPVVAGDRDAELRADDGAAGVVVLGERFGWRTGLAIALSFAGVLVLGFDPLVLDRRVAAADAGVGAVPRDRHGADERPARPRHVQPAGLDRDDQRAAAAGDRARCSSPARFAQLRDGELDRLGRRAVRGVRRPRCSATACTTCWCSAIRSRRSRRGCCWRRCSRSALGIAFWGDRRARACGSAARWCSAACC